MVSLNEIRNSFINYFAKNGHRSVESSSLAIANSYILFRISEGIFTNDDGTGAVQPGDFSVVFNINVNVFLYC